MPFCEYCGRPVADNEVCDCSTVSPKEKKVKKASSPAVKIGITAIVLLIVSFGAYFVWFTHGLMFSQRIKSTNSAAGSVYKAVNSSIYEMGEQGYNARGYYLICSDRSKNISIPNHLDEDRLYNSIRNFFSDSERFEWFAVVENDSVTYSALANSWKSKPVGSYPASDYSGISYYDTGFIETEERNKATLKMLYADTEKKVREKADDEDFLREILTTAEPTKE